MIKYILPIFLFSHFSFAKSEDVQKKKTTIYAMCSRNLKGIETQTIIFASETLTEAKCKSLGRKKAEQYVREGWKCAGKNNEELYSCEQDRASTFATYKGTRLDRLTFTNLQKHQGLLAYLNPNSIETCREDKSALIAAGVTDAVCHKRNHE